MIRKLIPIGLLMTSLAGCGSVAPSVSKESEVTRQESAPEPSPSLPLAEGPAQATVTLALRAGASPPQAGARILCAFVGDPGQASGLRLSGCTDSDGNPWPASAPTATASSASASLE